MKILTVIGARPQFVKAAVVSRAIRNFSGISEVLVHTGQHYDDNMSDVFFREMDIPSPAIHLGIGSGSHGKMTGRMLEKIEEVLVREKPSIVLVYGDTNTTLAGALAAAKLHIPVAHVEAGLRSWNFQMPEEINRILTDQLSHWLFCPTDTAVENLLSEGIREKLGAGRKVRNVGDVMYDAVLYYQAKASPSAMIEQFVRENGAGYVLATVHRAENTDCPERLMKIFDALQEVARQVPVICPVHPRTAARLAEQGIDLSSSSRNLYLCNPVGYFDMLTLQKSCRLVMTDSGGVQKEAYFFRKPCITLREETEWVELVQEGWNLLAGAEPDRILVAFRHFSGELPHWDERLYGDGQAGDKIVKELAEMMG